MLEKFNLYQEFVSVMERGCPAAEVVAIAVSGGSDSMALVLLANRFAAEKLLKIIALTVDHGLRPEAFDEALAVQKWLSSRGIEHHILKWEGDKKSSNIQAEARAARYRLMQDFCRKKNINTLLVAHNKEDQAETVLLRLMRGSGVDGLSGMDEVAEDGGFRILRPLLGVEKKYLRQFLQEQGQEWVEDPSNQNDKYARVNVRRFIENADEPELLVNRLVDTAENMRRSRDFIEKTVMQMMADVADIRPEGYCVIDIPKFLRLHEEAAYRILADVVKKIGGEYYRPRFEKLQNLYDNFKQKEFDDCTLGGCSIYASQKKDESGFVFVTREMADIADDVPVQNSEKFIWDNRFECRAFAKVANLRLGALKRGGFAGIEDKITSYLPKRVIYSLPAFMTLEKVVAVPHIGYLNEDFNEAEFFTKFIY
jgi:tRNA(Ile)-lysidine synthase